MRRYMLFASLAIGCTTPVGPPDGAVLLTPPPEYATWWGEVSDCTGRSGDLGRITWYVVPGDTWEEPEQGRRNIAGRWMDGHRIYVTEKYHRTEEIVKHEMMHDLGYGMERHEEAAFMGCAGIGHFREES